MSWRGSGIYAEFHSRWLFCSECDGEYLAEFETEWSSADIDWICEEPVKRPWWAFWRSKKCGYENLQEVEL